MSLKLSSEQRHIADAVDALLARESPSDSMRRAAFTQQGFDAALWHLLGAQGMCGVHLPQAHGGLGQGITELCLVAESLGHHLACVPWFESVVLAGTAFLFIDNEGASSRHLPGIAEGRLIATLDIGLVPGAPVWAQPHASGWRLDGDLAAVPAAARADLLLLLADSERGPLLIALPLNTPGVRRTPLNTHDATRPLARVQLEAVIVPADAVLQHDRAATQALDDTRQVANVALAAEQVGVAQRCLDLSVAYLSERQQFGRALASFQALKHRCAQMMVAVELARSAVLGAARGLDQRPSGRERLRLSAMARCQADEAAQFCTQEAIQLHGGVGFTWEFDPQLYFKRAQAAHAWLDNPAYWRERSAALWLDAPEYAA